ncbi:hypothetical protein IE81DRAFT_168636 [Ceraceosorus guamensis]|uniref:Uncharacterized protein n=1 Tax=Ceraceosorus guamensis TaxID=1522189 RepID=A0A316VVW0_9BASI|nr:hypothetical protein IE81DRAFT_168636 [Ceraceosorus guamensis]PWN41599.1 hypothetical protein IE81DRAFT_168636 [Ceraceosorus guamensis]
MWGAKRARNAEHDVVNGGHKVSHSPRSGRRRKKLMVSLTIVLRAVGPLSAGASFHGGELCQDD